MSAFVWAYESSLNSVADAVLEMAARLWFLVAIVGQWIFVFYVASFYGRSAMQGNFAAWNRVMPHGYIPGDAMGNFAVAMHLFLAVIIMTGGSLQLIPQIRSHAPSFHRWNRRLNMLAVFATSIVALYMVWIRGAVGDVVQHVGGSLDAILMMIFAVLALRHALARDMRTDRRWALRLFVAVNGFWFFRVGVLLWVFLNKGPVGFDPKTFTGPFLSFWSFGDYLLPLPILEIYLRTKNRAGVSGRFAMAGGLLVVTVAMGVRIFAATMGLWLPHI